MFPSEDEEPCSSQHIFNEVNWEADNWRKIFPLTSACKLKKSTTRWDNFRPVSPSNRDLRFSAEKQIENPLTTSSNCTMEMSFSAHSRAATRHTFWSIFSRLIRPQTWLSIVALHCSPSAASVINNRAANTSDYGNIYESLSTVYTPPVHMIQVDANDSSTSPFFISRLIKATSAFSKPKRSIWWREQVKTGTKLLWMDGWWMRLNF